MSLANIQRLLLHLAIDPYFLIKETDSTLRSEINSEYLTLAKTISPKLLEEFSLEVAQKRLNSTTLQSTLSRTQSYMDHTNQKDLFLRFISKNKMHKNEWTEKITTFFEFIIQHTNDVVLREIAQFERWLYTLEHLTEEAQINTLALSSTTSIYTSLLPAAFLIEKNIIEAQGVIELRKSFDTVSYILAKLNAEEIDLFEIDACYYEILQNCNQSRTTQELLCVIEQIANKHNYDCKKPTNILEELLELELLQMDS